MRFSQPEAYSIRRISAVQALGFTDSVQQMCYLAGVQVSMFFTFWGLSVLKKDKQFSGKSLFQKMMALMSPGSSKSLPVSQMNYFEVGAKMLRSMMKEKNVNSLEEMILLARELGVRMTACEMSRDVMGIKESELVDGLECGGVASFLADSLKSRTSLFI